MKTTTEMQLVPVTKLVPYVNNARTHSPEQINKLRSSLREFGFINPVIIDRDYGVIAGHGRILAAKEEGITEVPCVFADHLTEAQKKAYIIADNRMAMDAGWDEELLRVEIESLQAADFDPLLTGFGEKELSKLFDDGKDIQEDDFNVDAELQKPTFTKSGDIWTLGRHRLICGDSTKEETYAALMDGRKANLVITDPPYNVNYEGSAGKIKNDNMASEKFFDFLFDAFSNMEKVMADDASIYEEECSPTLRAGVVPAAVALENHPTDSRVKLSEDGNVQTLTSRMGTGGNNVPLVMKICSGCEGGGKGPLIQENKSATLSCNNDQTLFEPCGWDGGQVSPTLTKQNAGGNQRMPDKDNFTCVLQPFGISSKDSNAMKSDNPHSGIYEAETARTLDGNGGNPSCNQGGIAVVAFTQNQRDEVRDLGDRSAVVCANAGTKQQTFVLQGSMIGREDKNGPQGDGINEDVSFTLNTIDHLSGYPDK